MQDFFKRLANYPMPPEPFGLAGSVLPPSTSGVYFLYKNGKIDYVGKSIDLSARIGVSFSSHHAGRIGDLASWIEFPKEELEFDECFYIWLCRPGRNFGEKLNTLKGQYSSDRKIECRRWRPINTDYETDCHEFCANEFIENTLAIEIGSCLSLKEIVECFNKCYVPWEPQRLRKLIHSKSPLIESRRKGGCVWISNVRFLSEKESTLNGYLRENYRFSPDKSIRKNAMQDAFTRAVSGYSFAFTVEEVESAIYNLFPGVYEGLLPYNGRNVEHYINLGFI